MNQFHTLNTSGYEYLRWGQMQRHPLCRELLFPKELSSLGLP